MRIAPILITLALLGAALAACKPSGSSADGAVLATVDGKAITESDLRALERQNNHGQEMQLDDVRRQAAIKYLVNMQLLTTEAEKNGLDQKPDLQADLASIRNNMLAEADARDYVEKHKPSEADIKAAYDEQVKKMDPHEYKARHILVATEGEARDIIVQLGKGANFAVLAKKDSLDPGSKGNGGELGDWFSADKMVPEFGAALAKLKKGEYTHEPVKSSYGWHVIMLEDVRSTTPPTLEQMHDQIEQQLNSKVFSDHLDQLRGAAKIDVKTTAPATPAPLGAPTPATSKP